MQCAKIQPVPGEELAFFTDSQQLSQINWTPVGEQKHGKSNLCRQQNVSALIAVSSCVGLKRRRKLTVHLVGLQSRHQVPVHLNQRLLGLLVLIQDQLGGDGARHLRQLVLYNNNLETKGTILTDLSSS